MTLPLSTFLLVSLRHMGERGASEEILLTHARANSYEALAAPALERALRDLADARLVTSFEQPVLGKRWRITALGGSNLTEAGL